MLSVAKRFVVGTRWEAPVKRVHFALTRHRNSLYDSQTIEIMGRVLRPDSNGIDIGAFEGGMLRHMVRLAPQGRHLAFEPLPDKYQRLVKTFPTSLVYPYALGGEVGTVAFHCMHKHPALSGLKRRLGDLPNERVREIQVPMETLDRLIPSDLGVAFVKIDVEGGELGVFQGGIQTFRRARPVIVFECGLGGADYFDTRAESIFDIVVNEIGLKISLLDAWLSGREPLSRQGFIDQFERRLNFYFVAHPWH